MVVGERLYTVAESAKRLNIRCETILRWIHAGRLPAVMFPGGRYRIPESELDKMLRPVSKGVSHDNGNTGTADTINS